MAHPLLKAKYKTGEGNLYHDDVLVGIVSNWDRQRWAYICRVEGCKYKHNTEGRANAMRALTMHYYKEHC